MKEYEMQFEAYQFAQKQLDFRAALICSVIANGNRDPKKKKKPFEVDDFMSKEKKQHQKQTPEQMLNAVKMLNISFGGRG